MLRKIPSSCWWTGSSKPPEATEPEPEPWTPARVTEWNAYYDLYVALGDADKNGHWTIRAYWKPLIPWIWIGAILMAAGGVVSLSDRRWRVGVAVRASRAVPAAGE